MSEIRIALDFSRFPGGRHRNLGKFSGEEFRDDHLVPALKSGDEVTVVLDGTAGYGSSFLEEAFGGLIRVGMSKLQLQKTLKLVARSAEFTEFVDEIWEYISDEEERRLARA